VKSRIAVLRVWARVGGVRFEDVLCSLWVRRAAVPLSAGEIGTMATEDAIHGYMVGGADV